MSWWDHAVGYEVYLRSYVDTDGDGIGDLPGVTSRLDHLVELGIDVVWVTPCWPSPMKDHGYDVSSYLEVAEVFGGDDALDELIAEAHARDLRLVLDLVPNHTSDQHPWFREAVADPTSPKRDYYVWREGRDGGQRPPNNWISHFGGPAWTRDDASGQWYLHLFLPEQPDLNWENEAVREEFDHVLRHWFERGVDGFRIDVAHSLVKAAGLPDNDWPDPLPVVTDPMQRFADLAHTHDLDQPGVVEVYERWNRIAAEHDAHLVGEVYLPEAAQLERYVTPGRLHRAFYFPALHTGWVLDDVRHVVHEGVDRGRGRFAWPLASHDDPRAASRFGGGEAGRRRQEAYLALLCALPGMPYLYQGDELGLEAGALPPEALQDPVAVNNPGALGRDGSRTPIVWDTGPGRGFTTGTPWMPFGSNHGDDVAASTQRSDPDSTLHRTRAMLHTRRGLTTMLGTNDVDWLDDGPLVALRRGDVIAACNVGGPPTPLDVPAGELVHATDRDGTVLDGGRFVVPTDATVWWQVSA